MGMRYKRLLSADESRRKHLTPAKGAEPFTKRDTHEHDIS